MKGILVGMPLVVETDRLWQQRVSKEPVKLHGKGERMMAARPDVDGWRLAGRNVIFPEVLQQYASTGMNYGRYPSSVELVSVVEVVYRVRTQ
jgi:hypothetical protein